MQEVVIPEPVIAAIREMLRLQMILRKDPLLEYMPLMEFPSRFTICQRTENDGNIRFWYDGLGQTEVNIDSEPPDSERITRLIYFGEYWHDRILGLPPEKEKLVVQINAQELSKIFLLNLLEYATVKDNQVALAELERCRDQVGEIMVKIKRPIVRALEASGIPVPQPGNANNI